MCVCVYVCVCVCVCVCLLHLFFFKFYAHCKTFENRFVFERASNWKTSREYSNYSITDIGQNTEKSLGDLKRLVTPIPVKE